MDTFNGLLDNNGNRVACTYFDEIRVIPPFVLFSLYANIVDSPESALLLAFRNNAARKRGDDSFN